MNAKDMRRCFEKFHYECVGTGRGPHEKYKLYLRGVFAAWVCVSRGNKVIPPGTLGNIARQMKVKTTDLVPMCGCTISPEEHHRGLESAI